MKYLLSVIVMVLISGGSYTLGYFHAVTDSLPFMATAESTSALVTMKLIENNDLQRAIELTDKTIQLNFETIEIINEEKNDLLSIPSTALTYKRKFKENEADTEKRIERNKRLYTKLLNERPNQSLKGTK